MGLLTLLYLPFIWDRNGKKLTVECLKDQFLVLSFFLLYINDLPSIVTKENNIVLYADDASFVITNTDRVYFSIHINVLFNDINNWFESNLLNLNFTKTYYLEFSHLNVINLIHLFIIIVSTYEKQHKRSFLDCHLMIH